ncbi:hypothetical protein ARMSODRAFT_967038, partial [Armillaria solidipes]
MLLLLHDIIGIDKRLVFTSFQAHPPMYLFIVICFVSMITLCTPICFTPSPPSIHHLGFPHRRGCTTYLLVSSLSKLAEHLNRPSLKPDSHVVRDVRLQSR